MRIKKYQNRNRTDSHESKQATNHLYTNLAAKIYYELLYK